MRKTIELSVEFRVAADVIGPETPEAKRETGETMR